MVKTYFITAVSKDQKEFIKEHSTCVMGQHKKYSANNLVIFMLKEVKQVRGFYSFCQHEVAFIC